MAAYDPERELVIVETDPADTTRYRTPGGWRAVEQIPEIIAVAGTDPDTLVAAAGREVQ